MFRNYNAFKGHTMIFVAIKNDNCHCLERQQIQKPLLILNISQLRYFMVLQHAPMNS